MNAIAKLALPLLDFTPILKPVPAGVMVITNVVREFARKRSL